MRDSNLISNLQEKLKSLTVMYQNLEELIALLSSVIDNEEFVPEHLKDSINGVLSLISESQAEFVEQYNALEIGEPAARIPMINETLEIQLARLSEKKEFQEIVDYVKGLYSTDSDVDAALQKEKEALLSFEIEEASVENCKDALGKYSILRQAVEESDPKKRFDLAFSSLLGLFEKDILFGITNSSIHFQADKQDKNNSDESAVASDVQDVTSLKDIPEVEYTSDNKSKDDSFEQDVHEKEDACNDEVPENDLTSDEHPDVQVMEDNENDPWVDLGIHDHSSITYDIDGSLMKVNTPPKTKKFNASSFKKEIQSGPLAVFKNITLTHAFNHHGMVPASTASLLGMDKEDFKSAADRLVKTGYLSEYVLLKSGFDEYHSYYMLTPSGVKAF